VIAKVVQIIKKRYKMYLFVRIDKLFAGFDKIFVRFDNALPCPIMLLRQS
jgi:hypothetical protein